MSDITKLFANSSNAQTRAAMKELGSYYGVKDKNSFVQILLMGSAGGEPEKNPSSAEMSEQMKETNSNLQNLANAVISLQGDGVYSSQLKQVFDNYITGDPNDPIAKVLNDPATGNDAEGSPISLTLPSNGGEHKGYLRGVGVDSMLPKADFVISEDSTRRTISILEMHHPNLNFSNRDSAASSVFLMALPSIEISKAVPYFDIKTIVKGDPITEAAGGEENTMTFGNGISIYKFLHGERIEKGDAVLKQLARMIPNEFATKPKVLSGGVGQEETEGPAPVSVAGMEIFTSPQTMVDGTLQHIDLDATSANYGKGAEPSNIPLENKVLDKFRPLMTIKSFNVQVTPATGMLATKAADVKLTLHDKTRMNQIMPFIIPGQLGDVEFLVEWGWSHPQPDPNINPYGALINSMRVKEKYGIMNSTYSFTPEGQVDITLKLYTKGASNATFELVSNTGKKHPADVLKDLVGAIRSAMKSLKQSGYALNAEMGAPDILGKASSVGGILSLKKEEREKIKEFLSRMKSRASQSSASTWEEMVNSFDEAEEGVENFQEEIQEQFKEMIDNCCKAGAQVDPYLHPDQSGIISGYGHRVMNITRKKHVSFAKIITTFVANPILQTGKFNEVQLLFYPMNEYAMWARDLNVGQYPINKEALREFMETALNVTPSISIQKFLNMIKKHFINYVGDDIYGLSSFYNTTEDGKRELAEKWTKDEEAKQKFTELKVKVLEDCYGEASAEKRFKKPNVQMWVECVNHLQDPAQTILRLHFFDRACTSYGSYADMWGGANASNLGVIGKQVSAQKSLDKAKQNPPKKKDPGWEDLVAARQKRVTNYAKLANAQKQEFIDNGLLEPFDYIEKDRQTGEETTVSKFRIAGGPDQLRGILAANMPTLKYGTEFSGILAANIQTNSNPQMETIHMQRQGAKSGPSRATDTGLPMTVKPVTLSLDTFGCPYINFGQQFFVDFQTNTSIDDIYAVSGVSHSLSPNEFKTQIKLTPLNKLGQFRSMTDSLNESMALAASVGENISD
tara:strand:+ start:5645 stop:8713 length:3069 start_codon:yes stop_codon:yes gene_type:complete